MNTALNQEGYPMKRLRKLGLVAVLAALGLTVAAMPVASSAQQTVGNDELIDQQNPCPGNYYQLIIMVVAAPDSIIPGNIETGDALWKSHAQFMQTTHQQFLVSYSLTKGPQLANPLDPYSAPTGNTIYVLNECYKQLNDIALHWAYTEKYWSDFNAIIAWMETEGNQVFTSHMGVVQHSIWPVTLPALPPPPPYPAPETVPYTPFD